MASDRKSEFERSIRQLDSDSGMFSAIEKTLKRSCALNSIFDPRPPGLIETTYTHYLIHVGQIAVDTTKAFIISRTRPSRFMVIITTLYTARL